MREAPERPTQMAKSRGPNTLGSDGKGRQCASRRRKDCEAGGAVIPLRAKQVAPKLPLGRRSGRRGGSGTGSLP